MKQKKLARDWLAVAVLTVITVFTWIGLSLYQVLTQTPPPQIPPSLLLPLEPKLETKIIEKLAEKKLFSQDQIVLPQITPSPPEERRETPP